jgi:hypothetical protein
LFAAEEQKNKELQDARAEFDAALRQVYFFLVSFVSILLPS